MRKRKAGQSLLAFTLIELMTVIGLIIVLTALMVPMFGIFVGSHGVSSGHRIMTNVLLKARSMAVNTRRKFAVVFEQYDNYDHDSNPATPVYDGYDFDPMNTQHLMRGDWAASEQNFSGKMTIWDLDPKGDGSVPATKVPGEFTLPRNTVFSYAPSVIVFNSDGSLYMRRFTGPPDLGDLEQAIADCPSDSISDAPSPAFDTNVVEKVRKNLEPVWPGSAPYDIKIVTVGGQKCCYVNLIDITGRPGKFKIGLRETAQNTP